MGDIPAVFVAESEEYRGRRGTRKARVMGSELYQTRRSGKSLGALVAVDGGGLLVGLGGDLGLLLGDEVLDGGKDGVELLLRVLEDVGSLLRDGSVCSAKDGQSESTRPKSGRGRTGLDNLGLNVSGSLGESVDERLSLGLSGGGELLDVGGDVGRERLGLADDRVDSVSRRLLVVGESSDGRV